MSTEFQTPDVESTDVQTTHSNLEDRADAEVIRADVPFYRALYWPAIFAGVITAIGIHLLLITLGTGIGLATFNPLTDENPAKNFVTGAAIAWSLCALVALFVGGWMAGCFSA